ncbi:MAG TPA: proline iminopeptidase-family hydrolase [Ignavibacteriaceae bacterium]|nr:proline iminopeptidase-family hydrolase [Ignavibacteriaceae bacterium]
MKYLKLLSPFILLSFFLFSSCQSNKLEPKEGYINVTGGKVWYKTVGNGDKTPLVLLHGGPGMPSYYLNPMAPLGDERPVIFIDQLGCGRSDRITDTTLMTIPAYVKELKEIKDALELKDFFIFGNSWGSILAVEYYFAHPEGIKGLILSGPALDIHRWSMDADTLIATLPDSLQKAIRVNEKNGTYDSPEYQAAVEYYYSLYLARKQPWSPDLDSTFTYAGENVYLHMDGPSEFTLSGNLKDYDTTGKLGEIKVPTLFMGGEYDEARPRTVRYYASFVRGSKVAIIPDAGHISMHDNPEANNKAIRDFLHGIEK